jgi:hypothetical protein
MGFAELILWILLLPQEDMELQGVMGVNTGEALLLWFTMSGIGRTLWMLPHGELLWLELALNSLRH